MTTIAAIWTPTGGAIGGDRCTAVGNVLYARARPKVRQVAPWLALGFAGNGDADHWLWDLDVTQDAESLDDAYDVLTAKLAPWREHRGRFEACGLIALTPWGLMVVDDEARPTPVVAVGGPAVAAVGSGTSLALGALHVAGIVAPSPRDAVEGALDAAAARDPWTSPPFDIITMEGR